MTSTSFQLLASTLLPAALMLAAVPLRRTGSVPAVWGRFRWLSMAALTSAVASLGLQLAAEPGAPGTLLPGLSPTLTAAWVAVLVQLLGTVIGAFSSRYLQGEPGQPRYVAALGGVLAAVHVLLLADQWLVLIASWRLSAWPCSTCCASTAIGRSRCWRRTRSGLPTAWPMCC